MLHFYSLNCLIYKTVNIKGDWNEKDSCISYRMPTNNIIPMYTNIANFGAALEIDSLGIATCEGILTHRLIDGSCELVMKLQKLENKSWTTISTWTEEGSTKCSIYKNKAVSRGTYRVAVTAKIYDSSGSLVETQSVYSITDTY